MRQHNVARITITLPKGLLQIVDRLAKDRATTRSNIVAELLKKEEEAKTNALMQEGYREMAEENRRLAEESFPLVSKTIMKSTW